LNEYVLLRALVFLIIGGYTYITAGGNVEQAQKGKNTLVYVIMGLIIAWGSYAIIYYIIENLFK